MPRQKDRASMCCVSVHLHRRCHRVHRYVMPHDKQIVSAHLSCETRNPEAGRGRASELVLEQLDAIGELLAHRCVAKNVESHDSHKASSSYEWPVAWSCPPLDP